MAALKSCTGSVVGQLARTFKKCLADRKAAPVFRSVSGGPEPERNGAERWRNAEHANMFV
jgi:hypothetical protein